MPATAHQLQLEQTAFGKAQKMSEYSDRKIPPGNDLSEYSGKKIPPGNDLSEYSGKKIPPGNDLSEYSGKTNPQHKNQNKHLIINI